MLSLLGMAAVQYGLQFKWSVFPSFGIDPTTNRCLCGNAFCSSPGKHPMVPWREVATSDPVQIEQWWTQWPEANIGLVTGCASGVNVVDTDLKPDVDGEEVLRELAGKHDGLLPDTVEVLTGGGGHHRYYRCNGHAITNANQFPKGIDTRGDGGYVIAPPSRHVSGRCYEWEGSSDPMEGVMVADMPQWMIQYAVKKTVSNDGNGVLLPEPLPQYAEAGRNNTIVQSVGGWINEGHDYKSLALLAMQVNAQFDTPLSREEVCMAVGSTVATHVRNHPDQPVPIEHPKIEELPEIESEEELRFPEELYNLPGTAGEIQDWILRTARKPQPIFATTAAIMTCAVALGRTHATPTGLRSNLYFCDVAGTGSGKEHSRASMKKILFEAGKSEWLGGEDIRSGRAIVARATRTPNVAFLLDEMGMVLKGAQAHGQGHMAEMFRNLMTLSGSAQTIYSGAEYADQKHNPAQPIEYPCVHVHGSTTPGTLYAALMSEHMDNGFVNRFLCFESETMIPDTNRLSRPEPVPDGVTGWIHHVCNPEPGNANLEGINPATPRIVDVDGEALNLFDQYDDWITNKRRTLEKSDPEAGAHWARAVEHAAKIAMVLSMARDPDALMTLYDDAIMAIRLVNHCLAWIERKGRDHIADTDDEAKLKKCLALIKSAKKFKGDSTYGAHCAKGYMPHRFLLRKMGLKVREMDDLIETLAKRGQIKGAEAKAGKIAVKLYYATKDGAEIE